MDETSVSNKKRPFEDDVESDLANKKARRGDDIKSAGCLKQVAEMVLVLAAMGKMRAGRKPTAVEVKMMAEARVKLAEVCNEFAPKDVFPRDAFGMMIEDLGFNRIRETKLGILPQKMSIAQKLQLTKQKMEKSEVFPLHSTTYTPPVSSRSFQNNSPTVHSSPTSNSRNLPYQLPISEVRPVGSTVLTSSRANSVADHKPSHNPSWSIQSQSVSFNDMNNHKQHQMNFAVNTHAEIAKIVQRILHPHAPDHHPWTPPSRDYMNKPLTCQTCKSMINEVDTVLICDACEKGYHLRCLQLNPKSVFGDECREWHCVKCLAISNGKPLPLKYGRVMRNVNTSKQPASSAGGEPCLEKKVTSSDENFNQRLMSANGQDADVCSKALTHYGENGKNEEVVERGNMVKTSENCAMVRENDDVEWVGGVINEIDGKLYYGTCCVSGTTFKLQDYALFSSTGNTLMPNKLQSMWDDNKTNKKWVTVTRCFFPDDLPAGVGRPCAPESNEVYESNHETTLPAGQIHGPCQILSPRKFSEETFDKQKRFFLCKWFYDEKKRLFRDVTY